MPDSNITKRALALSIKELMHDIPFSKISVSNICEKCGMNRKSFYYHFKDKYELVNWIFYNEFMAFTIDKEYSNIWEFLESICSYFYDNRNFYKNALSVRGQNSFREYFCQLFQPIITKYLKIEFYTNKNANFFASYFYDAFLDAILNWLKSVPCMSPEDFVNLMKESTEGIAKTIVNKSNDYDSFMLS